MAATEAPAARSLAWPPDGSLDEGFAYWYYPLTTARAALMNALARIGRQPMERREHWFDELTRSLGHEQTRRGLLRRFSAGLAAAALGAGTQSRQMKASQFDTSCES